MKVIQLTDGTIQIINEDERPDGFIEELSVDSVSSEVPTSLIDECEKMCKDGKTRFIFDKHLTTTTRRRSYYSKKEVVDLNIDEILLDDYYISDESEFELMPSRFPYYDTETKMTCRWSKHKMVIDWIQKLGFEPGLSNMGPEMEQSFILSVYNGEGLILYKCILRIRPNLFVTLLAEYGDFIENKKTVYSGFFSKSKILEMLDETCPDIYKSIIRNVKLEDILK